MNQSSNLKILTPKGRNNPGIVRLLLAIGRPATMPNDSGSTPDANAGGAENNSGEVSIDADNTGNNATDGTT